MINHPVFFARNVKDYLRLEQVLVQSDDSSLATLEGALTGGRLEPTSLALARDAGCRPNRGTPPRPPRRVAPTSAWRRFGSESTWPNIGPGRPGIATIRTWIWSRDWGLRPTRCDWRSKKRCERTKCCSNSRSNCAPRSKRCPSKTPPSSGRKANPRIERSPISYFRGRRSIYCCGKTPTRTCRLAFGMRSLHIVPWEASIASAAGSTASRAIGVASKQPKQRQYSHPLDFPVLTIQWHAGGAVLP